MPVSLRGVAKIFVERPHSKNQLSALSFPAAQTFTSCGSVDILRKESFVRPAGKGRGTRAEAPLFHGELKLLGACEQSHKPQKSKGRKT
jgi:hypothetical protein